MNISQGPIILELTPAESHALVKALSELKLLKQKYPDERNGFDIQSQITAAAIHSHLEKFLNPSTNPT